MADKDYDSIIRTATGAAAACGPLALSPVPVTDTVAIAGIWATMMTAIARRAGHGLDKETAKMVALGVLGAAGSYWSGCKTFTWVLAKIPGPGMIVGSGVNGTLNAGFTLWVAYSFIDLFEEDDIDLTDWEFMITYLKGAVRPAANSAKLRRIRAFFRRMT